MELSFLVGGEAGMGVMVSGRVLSKAFVRGGYHVFATNEYPSLIRGGHNFYLARVSDEKVWSQVKRVDLLIALDRLTVERHEEKLHGGSVTIIDSRDSKGVEALDHLVEVPMSGIVKKANVPLILRNAVALGAAIAVLDYDLNLLFDVMRDTFREKLLEKNVEVARIGYEYVKETYNVSSFRIKLKPIENSKRLFMTGNESIALGALRSGMKIFAAYPMTPASPILHFLARLQKDFDVVVLQPESELAAINIVIGSWFAGVRAMTATSGGGFSLMTEAFGQAGITEIPVVVVLAQRQGPSTGLPTYTSQGDLRFVLHASQGEFPRVIIAPGDIEEAFYLTVEAFNIAERYQLPVVVLVDKYLAESYSSVDPFDLDKAKVVRGDIISGMYEGSEYKRYQLTETGISPVVIPGTKGAVVKVNSSEHDEYGFTCEDPLVVTRMNEKRFKKLELLAKEVETKGLGVRVYGDGEITLIAWGSTKGPILESMRVLLKRGIRIKYVQVVFLSPLPVNSIKTTLRDSNEIIVIENNMTGQLASLLRERVNIVPDHVITKYDGRPFHPEELIMRVEEVI
mgnify:CR=1 FL=1